jgi:hypothetical protein
MRAASGRPRRAAVTRTSRHLTIGSLACFAVVTGGWTGLGSVGMTASLPTDSAPLIVRTYDTCGLSAVALSFARRTADDILKDVGIAVVWRSCEVLGEPDGVRRRPGPVRNYRAHSSLDVQQRATIPRVLAGGRGSTPWIPLHRLCRSRRDARGARRCQQHHSPRSDDCSRGRQPAARNGHSLGSWTDAPILEQGRAQE